MISRELGVAFSAGGGGLKSPEEKKNAGWTLLQYRGLSYEGSAPLLPPTGAAWLDE